MIKSVARAKKWASAPKNTPIILFFGTKPNFFLIFVISGPNCTIYVLHSKIGVGNLFLTMYSPPLHKFHFLFHCVTYMCYMCCNSSFTFCVIVHYLANKQYVLFVVSPSYIVSPSCCYLLCFKALINDCLMLSVLFL